MDLPLALTFDDVLLQPAESQVLPHQADTAIVQSPGQGPAVFGQIEGPELSVGAEGLVSGQAGSFLAKTPSGA